MGRGGVGSGRGSRPRLRYHAILDASPLVLEARGRPYWRHRREEFAHRREQAERDRPGQPGVPRLLRGAIAPDAGEHGEHGPPGPRDQGGRAARRDRPAPAVLHAGVAPRRGVPGGPIHGRGRRPAAGLRLRRGVLPAGGHGPHRRGRRQRQVLARVRDRRRGDVLERRRTVRQEQRLRPAGRQQRPDVHQLRRGRKDALGRGGLRRAREGQGQREPRDRGRGGRDRGARPAQERRRRARVVERGRPAAPRGRVVAGEPRKRPRRAGRGHGPACDADVRLH